MPQPAPPPQSDQISRVNCSLQAHVHRDVELLDGEAEAGDLNAACLRVKGEVRHVHRAGRHQDPRRVPRHLAIHANSDGYGRLVDGGEVVHTEGMVKRKQRRTWLQQHPDFNSRDSFYQLSREDQVIIMRLRTGHSRLRHHMFTKFRVGESSACHCGISPMTVEHFPQDCQNHQNLTAGNLAC